MRFLRKFELTILGLAILINFVFGMNLPTDDFGGDSLNNDEENSGRLGLGLNLDLGVLDVGVGVHLGSESTEDYAKEETTSVVETEEAVVEQQIETSKEKDDLERLDNGVENSGRLGLGLNLDLGVLDVGLGVHLGSESTEDSAKEETTSVVETQEAVVEQQIETSKENDDLERLGVNLGLDVHLRSQSTENVETEAPHTNSVEQDVADSSRLGINLGLDVHLRTQSVENDELISQTVSVSETSEVPTQLISSAEASTDYETYEVSATVVAETTEVLEAVISETTESAIETTTTPVESAPICYTPGLQPHETDCHLYYSCSLDNSPDGNLHLETLSCSDYEAFNVKWGRCARELSTCPNPVTCTAPGSLADPLGNASYYLCYPRQTGEGGYLIYHVKCKTGEVFLPALGKCFMDLTDFAHAYMSYNWTEVHDLTVVTAEYKQYRMEEKLLMKMEKEKAKLQKKLQKELEKLAKQKAKEEAKSQKALLQF